ncbi:SusC/RagA family TonB-linked outer membrane protein [Polaribacter vadi]|uniref:SusC/RagA family TonB-linked outer membrane protein n=1 Tax=Polaribacter TaxID=52959 RepID=UPI001C081714|nr:MULTISPECIES: SusC/RagA family TonB-linked outer membrane protein [Polaribacter]MBU3009878.1 SusC/RagA family TonB-linked outer membrane protein [Polaribacter vadi]MDO6739684.1 SusC/RagA family TonB-linked outer membrane protein [Polaribacter sp. 1_MG-2023]
MKTKFNGILTLFLALVVQISFAQEKTISGTVSDESGALPGVSILIKGTNKGTDTDFDGKYTIKANTGDVLVFSYLGYESVEKTIGSNSTINVTLTEGGEILDEIVITGVAGATSRKKLSVTVNKISEKDLENIPTTSAANALQGKVAGVTVTNFGQPGQGATIQLRGATNIFGSQSPLVIVDGVIVENGLQDINSDDIASYEVVKGASASALYGSRAGNGVIVITTKKGKIGKMQVTLKSEVGISKLNSFIDLNNSHHYQLASDWQSAQGVYTKYAGVTYPSDYNGSNYQNVSGARLEEDDRIADNPYGIYYNNQDQFFDSGINKNLYASVSTATESSNLFLSIEKNNVAGILKNTGGYERNGVRLNGEFKINEWLKISSRNQFVRSFDNTPGGGTGVFFDVSVMDPDVNLNALNPDGQPYLYAPNTWASTVTNPLYPLYANPENRNDVKFSSALLTNVKFTDWLNLDIEYAIESVDSRLKDYTPTTTWTGGGTRADLFATYSVGSYFISSYRNTSQKLQTTLNFRESFGDDLTLTGKLSYLLENSDYEYYYGQGNTAVAGGRTISLDNYTDTFVGSDENNAVTNNYFAILGIDYKDRYIFDGMYRIDQSSLFGENHRTNDYFRASAAYRISKDVDIPGIQELKVHAAYGTAGQRPQYNWQYTRRNISNGIPSTSQTVGNPDLRPSTTTEKEFGLNVDFLDRFHLEGVYSNAKTEDQFMLVDLFAPSSAGSNQFQNIGTVEFSTLELVLDAKIVNTADFKWNTGVVFSTTTNEVTQLDISPRIEGPTDGEIFRLEEGVEFGTMYGRDFVRSLDQMAAQLPTGMDISDYVVNADGVVVEASTIGTVYESAILKENEDGSTWVGDVGNSTPDFNIGLRNTISYKGFDFYMLWDWKQGGDLYNRNGQWLTRDNRHAMIDQSGKAAGEQKTVNYYQSLYDVNQNNGFWVEDASFVKLREASIFYTLDSDKLKNVANGFFNSLRIGLTGNNLLTFTDYSGWDPEVQLYDGDTFQYYAVDYGVYPVSTSYTLSVTLKF